MAAPKKLQEGLSVIDLAALHESESNPRTISDERFEALKYALERDAEMLHARPIIALPSGEVVAGNMRLRALRAIGQAEAPVFVADLTPEKRREWMLRDNQEYGDWVPEDLAALVAAHRADEGDLKMLGFSEPAMDKLLKAHDDDLSGEAGGSGDDSTATEPEVWGVIVDCETEDQQADLMERLSAESFDVRALIPS